MPISFLNKYWSNQTTTTSITPEEHATARLRIFDDALDRLIIGPGGTFAVTCSCVFGLSAIEGWLHLSSNRQVSFLQKSHFVTRYALANIIPSIVWDRIKAETIVQALQLNPNILGKESASLSWNRRRLQSIRGSVAGTAILSQLVGLLNVSFSSKQDYSKRLLEGREPPFNLPSQKEVVIRLAGINSNVTSLSMERWGRRNIFPIYERDTQEVRQMVQKHGFDSERGLDSSSNHGVPVFWRVENGKYGDPDSWKGMAIPRQWLLTVKNTPQNAMNTSNSKNKKNAVNKILLLEADSVGRDSIECIFSPDMANESDLDLYEATQGFYQLTRLVEEDAPPFSTLRVLLVDSNAVVTSGGGRKRSIRNYVTNLGLADIIIDAREPLLSAVKDWLKHRSWDHLRGKRRIRLGTKKPVIVETPSSTFFQSLKQALEPFGYEVMDVADAQQEYGSIEHIPVLVNEDTSLATIHTVRKLLERKLSTAENVCAFCGDQGGLVELEPGHDSTIVTICSSDIYDGLFGLVREMAIQGFTKEQIQKRVDGYVCKSTGRRGGKQLGFPPS
ncbi:unnamed protein product [Cylindrotheca closterium]|uniref:Uncharacterized protein n=1 Tax=Cylindrotheca closterium TaxID=2856 RepID=A0AAD2JHN7_9STRA|nr:unnamed protein product [Cylindrotheca closterium]